MKNKFNTEFFVFYASAFLHGMASLLALVGAIDLFMYALITVVFASLIFVTFNTLVKSIRNNLLKMNSI